MITKIKDIAALPDKTTIDELQVTVTEVYPASDFQGKSVQNVKLSDGTGEIKASLWEHPDATPLKGREFILHSSKSGNGRFGGVSVKASTNPKYPGNTLSVSKSGVFQHVEVHQSQSGEAPSGHAKASSPSPEGSKATYISGQTVGMAIKCACDSLTQAGTGLEPDAVWKIASDIIRVAKKLENGELKEQGNNPF